MKLRRGRDCARLASTSRGPSYLRDPCLKDCRSSSKRVTMRLRYLKAKKRGPTCAREHPYIRASSQRGSFLGSEGSKHRLRKVKHGPNIPHSRDAAMEEIKPQRQRQISQRPVWVLLLCVSLWLALAAEGASSGSTHAGGPSRFDPEALGRAV